MTHHFAARTALAARPLSLSQSLFDVTVHAEERQCDPVAMAIALRYLQSLRSCAAEATTREAVDAG